MTSNGLMDSICKLIVHAPPLSGAEQADAMMALEDTMAVALAGWATPVSRACRTALGADDRPFLVGGEPGAPESCAFHLAVAAHALDYDDVHLTSVTHPSAVIFPALLALAARGRISPDAVLRAYGVGLAVNIALGEALGFEHYDAGWHATSTIGGIAAAAALAHALDLEDGAARSALALAAAQAGGLQRNFGTMAKPVQAGYAAQAAVRAALLAASGVTADPDIFGPRGFLDLYGDAGVDRRLPAVRPRYQLDTVSRKMFPCCYAAHRLIAAALEARRQLGDQAPPGGAEIGVSVPFGTLRPLRVIDPATGPEGQFCATYTVAVALISGGVSLTDFTDDAVARAPVRDLMSRIVVTEDPPEDPLPVGLDHGQVRLWVKADGQVVASAAVKAFPGSPAAPARPEAMGAKIADCLEVYNRGAARPMTRAGFDAALRGLVNVERVAAE
jgi:2-methylcitrate dehydratase PrpD